MLASDPNLVPLTGSEKAAIVLLTLGPSVSAEILKRLPEDEDLWSVQCAAAVGALGKRVQNQHMGLDPSRSWAISVRPACAACPRSVQIRQASRDLLDSEYSALGVLPCYSRNFL